jgi:hypothetical protein
MPLYQLMKKIDHFVWSQRADDAFNDLKGALSTTPILVAPAPREPMLLYIVATPRVISVVIMVERTEEGKELPIQRPVYYLSEVRTSPSKTTRTSRRSRTACTWRPRS